VLSVRLDACTCDPDPAVTLSAAPEKIKLERAYVRWAAPHEPKGNLQVPLVFLIENLIGIWDGVNEIRVNGVASDDLHHSRHIRKLIQQSPEFVKKAEDGGFA
jgi:hypothetical protein